MLCTAASDAGTARAQAFIQRPIAVQMPTCNSVAFSQIPNHPDTLMGRVQATSNPGECAPPKTPYTLALFHMDWQKHKLSLIRELFSVPMQLPGGRTLASAYDPYVIQYRGHYWLAFECVVPGPKSHASICTSQLDYKTFAFVPSTITVTVAGVIRDRENVMLSASVPKLLVSSGRLYMYWTVVRQDFESREFTALAQRGASMEVTAGRIYASGSQGRAVITDDPVLTVPMIGDAGSVGDMFDVKSNKDGSVLAFATEGNIMDAEGKACLNAIGTGEHCYFPRLARSPSPLTPMGFSAKNNTAMQLNIPGSYAYPRIMKSRDGQNLIIARTFGKFGAPDGLALWPLDPAIASRLED
jgi:hypothetical protein